MLINVRGFLHAFTLLAMATSLCAAPLRVWNFPALVYGPGRWSVLTITNRSQVARSIAIEAFDNHGNLGRTVDAITAIAEAHHNWAALAAIGINMDEVAAVLEREGVASFAKSFEDLLATMGERATEFLAK